MGTDYIVLEVPGLNTRDIRNSDLHWRWGQGNDTCGSDVALDCGSFQIRRGEILGVLGASGSGKSTLVRNVAALLNADGSHIVVSGPAVLRDELAVKRLINRVLADASLFRKLTPLENLIYGARLYCLGEKDAGACALKALKCVGLGEKAIHQPVEELSACLQRKVAAACAALTQPVFLLLDEPTAGLSNRSKKEMQSFIEELRDVYNATILLTTSDVGQADALCDRVVILDERQVVALGTPAHLKDLVPHTNDHAPTLRNAFTELTGKQLAQ